MKSLIEMSINELEIERARLDSIKRRNQEEMVKESLRQNIRATRKSLGLDSETGEPEE